MSSNPVQGQKLFENGAKQTTLYFNSVTQNQVDVSNVQQRNFNRPKENLPASTHFHQVDIAGLRRYSYAELRCILTYLFAYRVEHQQSKASPPSMGDIADNIERIPRQMDQEDLSLLQDIDGLQDEEQDAGTGSQPTQAIYQPKTPNQQELSHKEFKLDEKMSDDNLLSIAKNEEKGGKNKKESQIGMKKNGGKDESARNFTYQNVNQAKESPDRYASSTHVSPQAHASSSLVDEDKELEGQQVPDLNQMLPPENQSTYMRKREIKQQKKEEDDETKEILELIRRNPGYEAMQPKYKNRWIIRQKDLLFKLNIIAPGSEYITQMIQARCYPKQHSEFTPKFLESIKSVKANAIDNEKIEMKLKKTRCNLVKAAEDGQKKGREEYIEAWRAALRSDGEPASEKTMSEDIGQDQSAFNLDHTAMTQSQIPDNEGDYLDGLNDIPGDQMGGIAVHHSGAGNQDTLNRLNHHKTTLKASTSAELLPILASELLDRVKLDTLQFNCELLRGKFPFQLVVESYSGDLVHLRSFFQFLLNTMQTNPDAISANLRPLIFLLVSFSMQHEKSSNLAQLTKRVWEKVGDRLKDGMKGLLSWRWPGEHIQEHYFEVHCAFSPKLYELLDLFHNNHEEHFQFIHLLKFINQPAVENEGWYKVPIYQQYLTSCHKTTGMKKFMDQHFHNLGGRSYTGEQFTALLDVVQFACTDDWESILKKPDSEWNALMDESRLKRIKTEEEGMQEQKQHQQLLKNLGDQTDISGDKDLDQAIRAAFSPSFDAREYQVALIKLLHQQKTKIVVAEWPTSAGKSVVLPVYAEFLRTQDSKSKIVICVPQSLLALVMRNDCMKGISCDSSGLGKVETTGIYVCTPSELLNLSDDVLSEIILEIDEFHRVHQINGMWGKICKAKQVFGLSATLGGRIGKENLQRFTDQITIIDTVDQLEKTGKIELDIIKAKKDRTFGKECLFQKAGQLIKAKVGANIPVILYLKDIDECNKFKKKLDSKYFVFDPDNKDEEMSNLTMLGQIKKGENGAPKVILTTKNASYGFNFFPSCYPIMTQIPDTWEEYQQIAGRSNRVSHKCVKNLALLTSIHTDQVSMEMTLRNKEYEQ